MLSCLALASTVVEVRNMRWDAIVIDADEMKESPDGKEEESAG
jgi:hypothetical protein